MDDIIRDKNLIDSMMDYSKICERQQDQISKLTEQLDRVNNMIDKLQSEKESLQNKYDTLFEKHTALRDELDAQVKKCDDAVNAYMQLRLLYQQLETKKNSKQVNGSLVKIDRDTFLAAYDITHDLYELGKILGVSRQTVYNYRRMYL